MEVSSWVWTEGGTLTCFSRRSHSRPSPSPPSSSGPQNCAACVHEGIYEEGISILESSSVSEQS